MLKHYLLLLLGVFCMSTAVIWIKETTEHPVLLAAYRQLIASFVLFPLFVRDRRRHHASYTRAQARAAFLGGALLGAHFILWILGARLARTANATLIVNLAPLALPFVLYAMARETLTRTEWMATGLTLVGLVIMGVSDFRIDQTHALGDLYCFLSMLLFAVYLGMARRNRDIASIWLYVVPLYFAGGMLCLLVGLFMADPVKAYTSKEVLMIGALALVPTIVGHSIINVSMKHLRGQTVSIINMMQFLFAGVMGLALYSERPQWIFYPCSVLFLGAAWMVLKQRRIA